MSIPHENGTEPAYVEGDAYRSIVVHINGCYGGKISELEAHEAARNLVGFCHLLLEIESQRL